MAKRRQEDPSVGQPWLNTFADLMNLLLCFFVLLFAASTVDAEKYEQIAASFTNSYSIFTTGGEGIGDGTMVSSGASQLNNVDQYFTEMGKANETDENAETDPMMEYAKKMQESAESTYDKVAELADRYNMDDYVKLDIDENNRFVRISLSGAILFDSGQADIKADAQPILDKLASILARFKDYQIVVEGHTDNQQITNTTLYKDNRWLSTARACTVTEYLIRSNNKLSPKNLESSGRGEYDPIASNSTPEGRAKNRRVEIKIYNEIKEN